MSQSGTRPPTLGTMRFIWSALCVGPMVYVAMAVGVLANGLFYALIGHALRQWSSARNDTPDARLKDEA